MSLNCEACTERYATTQPSEGEYLCFDCIANKPHAANDNIGVSHLVELLYAEHDNLAHQLSAVLRLFKRELAGSYSTAEQQQAIRDARAALAEVGLK